MSKKEVSTESCKCDVCKQDIPLHEEELASGGTKVTPMGAIYLNNINPYTYELIYPDLQSEYSICLRCMLKVFDTKLKSEGGKLTNNK